MRFATLSTLSLIAALAAPAPAQELKQRLTRQAGPQYVIHEWGTFTTLTRGDGRMIQWHPLSGASDLPKFVHDLRGRVKGSFAGTVRMETPVIYFHTKEAFSVDVLVDFPKGKVTEWYPSASPAGTKHRGIAWHGVEVLPGSRKALPTGGKKKNHYYVAREVDCAQVRVETKKGPQLEQFLFYRGVGTFDLPIEVYYEEGNVRVANTGEQSFRYLLFDNDGGRVSYSLHTALPGKSAPRLSRPSRTQRAHRDGKHESRLERMLVYAGLYRDEARAMVKAWSDTWFHDGIRVFWIVPEAVTKRVLPLTMKPAPQESVRVLVGQVEILTPDFIETVEANAARLASSDAATRKAAVDRLRALSRFAEPVLQRFARGQKDRSLQVEVYKLLAMRAK